MNPEYDGTEKHRKARQTDGRTTNNRQTDKPTERQTERQTKKQSTEGNRAIIPKKRKFMDVEGLLGRFSSIG